jgi:hypothetical protein
MPLVRALPQVVWAKGPHRGHSPNRKVNDNGRAEPCLTSRAAKPELRSPLVKHCESRAYGDDTNATLLAKAKSFNPNAPFHTISNFPRHHLTARRNLAPLQFCTRLPATHVCVEKATCNMHSSLVSDDVSQEIVRID